MSELTDNPMLPIEERLEIAIGGRDYFKECHKNARLRVEALEAENAALSAVVERQREALNDFLIADEKAEGYGVAGVAEDIRDKARAVLALTPATALRLHDAEVLDRWATDRLERMTPPHDRTEFGEGVAAAYEECKREAARLRAGGEG